MPSSRLKIISHLGRWLLLGAILIMPQASAHDTKLTEPLADQWKSIFICSGKSTPECIISIGDEHPALSHLALQRIGASEAYGLKGKNIRVTDLNASVFRGGELGPDEDLSSNEALIQREIPAPANFSGLPDFSYSIYDWANKNRICPSMPDDANEVEKCHMFKGWLGGGLNSSHFGSQATKIYNHLHGIALKEAAHAKSMREKITADGKIDQENFKSFIEEAELLALAYEGYGQHFLADRWAIGHMWERWNAPDFKNRAYSSLDGNFEVGMAAGLLHGSEGVFKDMKIVGPVTVSTVTNVKDPMSSPSARKTTKGILEELEYLDEWQKKDLRKTLGIAEKSNLKNAILGFVENKNESQIKLVIQQIFFARYRHDNQRKEDAPIDALGDMRLPDMVYGKYKNNVVRQREEMFGCLSAGWSEVIRAFGPGNKGGFGSRNVKLTGITGFKALNYQCDDIWATNGAIGLGWNLDMFAKVAGVASNYINLGHLGYKTEAKSTAGTLINRTDWISITAGVFLYNKIFGADGIELAKGKIGDFGSAKTGNLYPMPDYLPPEDLKSLPDRDPQTGRDKDALFGVFNKAHADYWCGKAGVEKLTALRNSGTVKDLAACRYLATRFYEGTVPKYRGEMTEIRTRNMGEFSPPSHGICYYYGARKLWNPNTPDEVPYYLSPGYVRDPYKSSRYTPSGYESIANWCAKKPVFDYLSGAGRGMPDETVFGIKDWDETITLRGTSLGSEPGKLWINCGSAAKKQIPESDIISWAINQIKFRITGLSEDEKAVDKVTVCMETDKQVKSVGLFILNIDKQPVQIEDFKVSVKGVTYFSKAKNLSRPIPPGPATYEITFSEPMTYGLPATIGFARPEDKRICGTKNDVDFPYILIQGRWVDEKIWRGSYDNPDPSKAGSKIALKDRQQIMVKAQALSGIPVDAGEKANAKWLDIYGSFKKTQDFSEYPFNRETFVTFGDKQDEQPPEAVQETKQTPPEGISGCWQTQAGWASIWQSGDEVELRLFEPVLVVFDLPNGEVESQWTDRSDRPFKGRIGVSPLRLFRPITSLRDWNIFGGGGRDIYKSLAGVAGLGSEFNLDVKPISGGKPITDLKSVKLTDFEANIIDDKTVARYRLWARYYASTHGVYNMSSVTDGNINLQDVIFDYRTTDISKLDGPVRGGYAINEKTLLRRSETRLGFISSNSPFKPDRDRASVAIYDPAFKNKIKTVNSGERIGIRAHVKGGCPTSIDKVGVLVKTGNYQAPGFSAFLTETGPNSGIYETPPEGLAFRQLFTGRDQEVTLTPILFEYINPDDPYSSLVPPQNFGAAPEIVDNMPDSVIDNLARDNQKMQDMLSRSTALGKQIKQLIQDEKQGVFPDDDQIMKMNKLFEKLRIDFKKTKKKDVNAEINDMARAMARGLKRLGQDMKDYQAAKKRAAAKKKVAAAAKAKAGAVGPPIPKPKPGPKPKPKPKPKPGPGPNKAGSGKPDIRDCVENSPDFKCWTEDQLRAESTRLETLFRRINGGEGVMVYRRQYKMPNGRFAIRLENSEQAEYRPPLAEMVDETRFIRKKPVLDALRRAQSDIEVILSSR